MAAIKINLITIPISLSLCITDRLYIYILGSYLDIQRRDQTTSRNSLKYKLVEENNKLIIGDDELLKDNNKRLKQDMQVIKSRDMLNSIQFKKLKLVHIHHKLKLGFCFLFWRSCSWLKQLYHRFRSGDLITSARLVLTYPYPKSITGPDRGILCYIQTMKKFLTNWNSKWWVQRNMPEASSETMVSSENQFEENSFLVKSHLPYIPHLSHSLLHVRIWRICGSDYLAQPKCQITRGSIINKLTSSEKSKSDGDNKYLHETRTRDILGAIYFKEVPSWSCDITFSWRISTCYQNQTWRILPEWPAKMLCKVVWLLDRSQSMLQLWISLNSRFNTDHYTRYDLSTFFDGEVINTAFVSYGKYDHHHLFIEDILW